VVGSRSVRSAKNVLNSDRLECSCHLSRNSLQTYGGSKDFQGGCSGYRAVLHRCSRLHHPKAASPRAAGCGLLKARTLTNTLIQLVRLTSTAADEHRCDSSWTTNSFLIDPISSDGRLPLGIASRESRQFKITVDTSSSP
jgi:hypothetical protein